LPLLPAKHQRTTSCSCSNTTNANTATPRLHTAANPYTTAATTPRRNPPLALPLHLLPLRRNEHRPSRLVHPFLQRGGIPVIGHGIGALVEYVFQQAGLAEGAVAIGFGELNVHDALVLLMVMVMVMVMVVIVEGDDALEEEAADDVFDSAADLGAGCVLLWWWLRWLLLLRLLLLLLLLLGFLS
jgi:hypothetical protein